MERRYMTEVIRVRITPEYKKHLDKLCDKYGIAHSDMYRVGLKMVMEQIRLSEDKPATAMMIKEESVLIIHDMTYQCYAKTSEIDE